MKKALVLSLAFVLGLGAASFAQTLSGSWDTTITILPGVAVQLSIDSELVVTYAVSGWTFSSISVLDETGWLEQNFDVEGSLGAFTLGSNLMFDPVNVEFGQWVVHGGMSLAGVTFDAVFALTTIEPTSPPIVGTNDVALQVTAGGSAGNVDIEVAVKFGSAYQQLDPANADYSTTLWYIGDALNVCDFDWSGVVITVDFPFCCAEVSSEISFSCDGFDYVTFSVGNILIPNLPWVKLGAVLTFTEDTKTLVINPTFNWGAITCFNLYIGQIHSGPNAFPVTLGDIVIEGIGLTCTIGGVQFQALSWLDGTTSHGGTSMPSALKVMVNGVQKTYWEMYKITTTDDGCCGPFDFSVAVYFAQNSTELFDVSLIKADMSIQVATQFTFSTGVLIDLAASPAFTQWTIGFLVEW